MKWVKNYYINSIFVNGFIYISQFTLLAGIIISFVLLGNRLTLSKIFTILSINESIRTSTTKLPKLIELIIDIMVSSIRLTTYLLCEEINKPKNSYLKKDENHIEIKNYNFYFKQFKIEEN